MTLLTHSRYKHKFQRRECSGLKTGVMEVRGRDQKPCQRYLFDQPGAESLTAVSQSLQLPTRMG